MPEQRDLNDAGVRLFIGALYNHDYLWFSSTESGQVSTTLPVLHNYALSYALSGYSWAVAPALPRYQADLARMRLYALPTELPVSPARTAITFNALDSLTLRTDVGPNVNTPNLGKRIYLDPIYGSGEPADSRRAGANYAAYAFVFDGPAPLSVFRLGKKGAPMRAYWHEVLHPRAEFYAEPRQPSHLVNPLDVVGVVTRFEPVTIPPHLLLRSVAITNDWFVRAEGTILHVPRLVQERMIL